MMRILPLATALLAVTPAAHPHARSVATPISRDLLGVTCPRINSCWAVGNQIPSTVPRTLIEHWNGTKWSLKASPSVPGSAATVLNGVSCPARLDCWAVGSATLSSTRQEPIAEHWNGSIWSLRVLPEPTGLVADELRSVWCPGTTRCWAVGFASRKLGGPPRPLAEHWTGRKWSVVPTRAAGSFSNLNGVFCRRDINCWAVGAGSKPFGALAEHWNGRRWSVVATPAGTGGGLLSVWCPGTDCFAVGLDGFPATMAQRWNGTKWSLTKTAPLPQGTISQLLGVSCPTSASCFAGGSANKRTLIEHWQGSKWVLAKNPNLAGELQSMFCLSRSSCWAVGVSTSAGPGTLAEHWNGTRWTIVATP